MHKKLTFVGAVLLLPTLSKMAFDQIKIPTGGAMFLALLFGIFLWLSNHFA